VVRYLVKSGKVVKRTPLTRARRTLSSRYRQTNSSSFTIDRSGPRRAPPQGQLRWGFNARPDQTARLLHQPVSPLTRTLSASCRRIVRRSIRARQYNPAVSEGATESASTPVDEISQLLRAWSDGDQLALDELTPIVYAELRRLAHRYMRRERPDHDLQTSALVNEAYIRLVDYKRMQWQNRAHFFAVSAQLMRRILVEHARRRNLKRGRGVHHVSLDETVLVGVDPGVDLVALDDALNTLARADPRKVQVVEMRFFGGLTVEETATVLKVSPVTVRRDWSSARIWLYRELTGATDDGLRSLETAR
jgi:RNA polymerase sigma factor (TIGR02999 family)